jgi:hypothetical protein
MISKIQEGAKEAVVEMEIGVKRVSDGGGLARQAGTSISSISDAAQPADGASWRRDLELHDRYRHSIVRGIWNSSKMIEYADGVGLKIQSSVVRGCFESTEKVYTKNVQAFFIFMCLVTSKESSNDQHRRKHNRRCHISKFQ